MNIFIQKNLKVVWLNILFFMGACAEPKPALVFSWHGGAMSVLIPLNSLISKDINNLNGQLIEHYGISAGAIVGALLSKGYTPSQVKDFFHKNAKEAFGLDLVVASTLLGDTQAHDFIKKKLEEIFTNETLAQYPNLHVIAAQGKNVVELSSGTDFGHILVVDAVLASISIPKIFGYHSIEGKEYYDASAMSKPLNDPISLIPAQKEQIIFSMGNGFRESSDKPVRADVILLKGPSPERIKAAVQDISLQDEVARLRKKLSSSQTGAMMLSLLDAKLGSGPMTVGELLPKISNFVDEQMLISSLSNSEALDAFARLGEEMAKMNKQALEKLKVSLSQQ